MVKISGYEEGPIGKLRKGSVDADELAPGAVNRASLAPDVVAPLADLTFNADGSITDTGSIPTTTTFNADGSITTAYGAPTNRTVVTTFNADGTITEVAS